MASVYSDISHLKYATRKASEGYAIPKCMYAFYISSVAEDGNLLRTHVYLRGSGLSFADKETGGSRIHGHERLMEQSLCINTRSGYLTHCLSACILFLEVTFKKLDL
jgi:hypothetical protein